MKKSNVVLISLLVALYIIPAMVWGINKLSSNSDYYTGFGDNIRIVSIENSLLKKEDIVVNTERVSKFMQNGLNMSNQQSYLYYKGNRKFLPEASIENDMLIVGKATDAPADAKLKLHIRINDITAIVLNGETVWRR